MCVCVQNYMEGGRGGREGGREGEREGGREGGRERALTSDSRSEEKGGDELKRRGDEGHIAKGLVSLHFTHVQLELENKQTDKQTQKLFTVPLSYT